MKRIILSALALALLTAQAQASAGFSCEADDKNVTKLVIEGATPRSGGALINFGGVAEDGGEQVDVKLADVKGFTGKNGIIQVRATARAGEETFSVYLNVRRNPKDEDDWGGAYEVAYGPKAKPKATIKRGKVKCAVE